MSGRIQASDDKREAITTMMTKMPSLVEIDQCDPVGVDKPEVDQLGKTPSHYRLEAREVGESPVLLAPKQPMRLLMTRTNLLPKRHILWEKTKDGACS